MRVVEGVASIGDVDAFVERLAAVGDDHDCVVQAFDARAVVDRAHLERAVELAERERGRGEAIADDPAVEILLYAAGRRQIRRAMELGVSAGECPVAVVVHGPDGDEDAAATAVHELLTPAETLGEYDAERVRAFFDVTERELAATDAGLSALVRERVALLVVER
ncbi:MAG: KEOPS complex subunit Cgi121 [Halorientalis sp.]